MATIAQCQRSVYLLFEHQPDEPPTILGRRLPASLAAADKMPEARCLRLRQFPCRGKGHNLDLCWVRQTAGAKLRADLPFRAVGTAFLEKSWRYERGQAHPIPRRTQIAFQPGYHLVLINPGKEGAAGHR